MISKNELLDLPKTRVVELLVKSNDENKSLRYDLFHQTAFCNNLQELIKSIRHSLYARDTDDAILDEINDLLTKAGFPWEPED